MDTQTTTLNKQNIKSNTGVNLEEYKTDVLVDSIMGFVEAPFTIMLHLILWPIAATILLLAIGIWVILPLGYLVGTIWIVLAVLMGIITGLAVGAFFIVWNLTDHSKNLFESTLQTVDEVIRDMQMGRVAVPKNKKLPTIGEWLRVIRLVVVVPITREVIRRKLWPIGDWVGNMATQMLTKNNKRAVASLKTMGKTAIEAYSSDKLEEYCTKMLARTQKLRKNTASIHKFTIKLTVAPLRLIMVSVLVADWFIFYGLWCWL